MSEKFTQDDVQISENSSAYSGFFKMQKIRLKHRLFAGGWSNTFVRELFAQGESAAVLLYDQVKDRVVMIEQFRIGALTEKSPWLLEIVAGMTEEGENPTEVVSRETMEEAGCEIKELIDIYRYYPSPGGSSEVIHLFCGLVDSDNAKGIHGEIHENEDIRVKVLDFDEAYGMMATGVICNATSIIALQWLKINRKAMFCKKMESGD